MPTFFFHSGMAGAPTNTSVAPSTLEIIRACLTTGFNLKSVVSASVASGVMTLSFAAPHGYEDKVWIRLDGAAGGSIVQRATTADGASTLTIPAPGFADGAVGGTLSTRVAPADWEEVFTGTNVGVFRSKVEGPGCTRFFYRVSDTVSGDSVALLRGFESMSDVDTGIGPFPTVAQIGGDGQQIFRSSGAARAWAAVCDGRTIYLTLGRYHNQGNPSQTLFSSILWFGDEQPLNPSDNFCAAVGGAESQFLSGTYHRARAFGGAVGAQVTNAPSVASLRTFPSPVFGGLMLLQPRLLFNGTSDHRSILRGALDTTGNPLGITAVHSVMDGVSGLSGRVIFLKTGNGSSTMVAAFHDGDWP